MPSSKEKKELISQFKSFTSASDKVAKEYLSVTNWKLDVAVDNYFQNPPEPEVSKVSSDSSKIQSLFSKYAGKGADVMEADGVEKLASDLSIDPNDIIFFAFAWKCNAQSLGEFSKTEFCEGMANLGVDSVKGLKSRLEALRQELTNKRQYREFYIFVFQYGTTEGAKVLALEIATFLWSMVLDKKVFKHHDEWIEFLETEHKRGINKDVWTLIYEFSQTINKKMDNYDDDGAWPLLIDQFVEWYKENKLK